jgi:hypothetical protein
MEAFQFYLQSVKQGKVGGRGATVLLFLVKKNSLMKKEV